MHPSVHPVYALIAAALLSVLSIPAGAGAEWPEEEDPALQNAEVIDVLRDVGVLDAEEHREARKRLSRRLSTAIRPTVEFIGTYTALNEMPPDQIITFPGSSEKERGFAIRKTAFGLQGRLFYEWLRFKVTASAEQKPDGTLEFGLENAYLDASFTPESRKGTNFVHTHGLTFGAMKVPVTRQILTKEPMLQFINRAVVVDEIEIYRDVGATLNARYCFGGDRAVIQVRGGAFSGQGHRVYSPDNNDSLMYVARVRVDLLSPMAPGEGDPRPASVLRQLLGGDLSLEEPQLSLGGTFLQNNDIDRRVRTWGLDGEVRWMGLSLQGAYLRNNFRPDPSQDITDPILAEEWETWGWYLQGGIFVWPRLVELAARYEEYTTDLLNQLIPERKIAHTTLGLNVHLAGRHRLKAMVNYVRRDERHGLPQIDDDTVTLAVSGWF